MRSQFVSLKRDLSNQKLQVPKQLLGAEMERFVRKRVLDESSTSATNDFMRSRSPHRGQVFQGHVAPSSLSRVSSAVLNVYDDMYDNIDTNDEIFDICGFVPVRPTVNFNIDNMEW